MRQSTSNSKEESCAVLFFLLFRVWSDDINNKSESRYCHRNGGCPFIGDEHPLPYLTLPVHFKEQDSVNNLASVANSHF